MKKIFSDAVRNAKKQIENINFMLKTRMKPTYFTRDSAKMSFTESMYFILRNNTKTMQIEIDEFFNQNKESGISMTTMEMVTSKDIEVIDYFVSMVV